MSVGGSGGEWALNKMVCNTNTKNGKRKVNP